MSTKVNESEVADIAKLTVHRHIARQIRRDPQLVERAKAMHARHRRMHVEEPIRRILQVIDLFLGVRLRGGRDGFGLAVIL
jgi:hypothetical protein